MHMLDGRTHQQLRVWTASELGHHDESDLVVDEIEVGLKWSPDGSQLVVWALALTAIITFGQEQQP